MTEKLTFKIFSHVDTIGQKCITTDTPLVENGTRVIRMKYKMIFLFRINHINLQFLFVDTIIRILFMLLCVISQCVASNL